MTVKENENGIYIVAFVTILFILLAWCLNGYFLKDLEPNDRGTLGDMFGTVNALFSGLALAGIIFTILLQRKELAYQREELKETRKEFIIQNKTLKAQRFENTFFNLLALHNQILNDIDYDKQVPIGRQTMKYYTKGGQDASNTGITTVRGRDVFRDRFKDLNELLRNKEEFEATFLNFYEKRKTDFGHYFRNLYRIFKMVNETEFKDLVELEINDISGEHNRNIYYLENFKERYRYTSIVRAQLSDYELLLLFYNCLSSNGKDKFKPLVEEYAHLKNLPKHDIRREEWLTLYLDSAYVNKNESSS